MQSKPGTYAIVFQSFRSTNTQIGHWGSLDIHPGYYIYVGSAFGPGGVQARVLRHCRKTKSRHWHVDYLREQMEPMFAWYSYEPTNLEHRWAQALSKMEQMFPVKGFGCTDCKCYTHLFTLKTKPNIARFNRAVGISAKTWIYQPDGSF
jgi:Uri superfamily endonuclease